jgi:hypothetical protein
MHSLPGAVHIGALVIGGLFSSFSSNSAASATLVEKHERKRKEDGEYETLIERTPQLLSTLQAPHGQYRVVCIRRSSLAAYSPVGVVGSGRSRQRLDISFDFCLVDSQVFSHKVIEVNVHKARATTLDYRCPIVRFFFSPYRSRSTGPIFFVWHWRSFPREDSVQASLASRKEKWPTIGHSRHRPIC